MKKQILNLGKNLNKTEQKLINGGYEMPYCDPLYYKLCPTQFGGVTCCPITDPEVY